MYRILLAGLILILATAACSLGGGSSVEPTPLPTSFIIITATNLPASATPQPSVTPTRQTSSSGGTTNVSNCTPRTDWVQYTVVSGDTLGTLADRTGSTVAALSQGNCLSNADIIRVGQVLRLPKAPVVIPTPTSAPGMDGYVFVNGVASFNHELVASNVASLEWDKAPRNAARIDFSFAYPDATTRLINTDYTASDGAKTTWSPPPDVRVTIYAVAYRADGSVLLRSNLSQVMAYSAPVYVESGQVNFSRYLSAEGGSYLLPVGETINLSWAEFPRDTFAVDFVLMYDDGSTSVAGSDTNPSDGAMISWNVPVNLDASVKAIAFNRGGIAIGNSYPTSVYSQPGFVPN